MSMASPSTDSTSTAPSSPSSCTYGSSSRTRYTFPCACQRDDVIGDLARRAIRADHNDARDAPHPLALVRRVPARPHDERGDRLVPGQRGDLLDAERLPRREGDRPGERATHLLLHTRVEHRARALLDPSLEHVLGHVEPDDEGRMPRLTGPEPVLAGRERGARLGELQ